MKLETRHYIGIGVGLAILIGNIFLFRESKAFYFFVGIAALVIALPFVVSVIIKAGREREKEEMFLDFSRSLVESVKAGTPISKSIINITARGGKYGSLSPHIEKLANQIALGIPVRGALNIFARDISNKVITKSVALIAEAEESGGNIGEILESVAKTVSEIEDTKKERKSSLFNTIVQLYIIFLIFLVIMLIVQLKFIPSLIGVMGTTGTEGMLGFGIGGGVIEQEVMDKLFLILMVVQGFFAGLVIGKLSEGSIRFGIKHSVIITAIAYLITTGIRAFVPLAAAAP